MAFDLDGQALGYGSGSTNFEPTAGDHVINAYARVTNITKKTITIADATDASKFSAGTEVLLQIVNVNSTSYRSKLGGWRVCKITAVSGNVLTVTNSPSQLIKASLPNTTTQIITVPTYKNFTINEGVNIKPTPYADGRGGVVAFKCSGTLNFNGGHIDLTNAGLSTARTLLAQEDNQTTLDSQYKYSCWENYATQKHFTLQQGDGAAFIICKKFSGNANSRIGNPAAQGIHYQRGMAKNNSWKNSPVGLSTGFTMTGGSTILICAGSMSSVNVKMFAKYRSAGDDNKTRGFGRCYIASETTLRLDEACYAYDRISTPSRLTDTFNIKDFGDGSEGVGNNVSVMLNNYARVTAINDDRNILSIAAKTTSGVAKWKTGALVMVLPMHKDGNVKYTGRFHIAHIIGIKGSKITLDAPIPYLGSFNLTFYDFQIITIPQYSSFTLSGENNTTSAYNSDKGRGGVFALACSGTCNLSGGKINVEGKGGRDPYGKDGLGYISNGGMATRLPIGQGHGSVFILAKNLIMDSSTRIGATYSGANYGGSTPFQSGNPQYGYIGSQPVDAASNDKSSNSDSSLGLDGTRGFGGQGGTHSEGHNGGTGSNATGAKASKEGGRQGAHVMIVADKITGFNIAAISTGGESAVKWAGKYARTSNWSYVFHGGASYGGAGIHSVVDKKVSGGKQIDVFALNGSGGFVNGGSGSGNKTEFGLGGGSAGFAFVYCNEFASQATANIFID